MLDADLDEKEILFDPQHTVLVAPRDLSALAFNWAAAQAVGESIQVNIYQNYDISIQCLKRHETYWGDNLIWNPYHNSDFLHEFMLKHKFGVMPLDEEGTRWEAKFPNGPLRAKAANPQLAGFLLLIKRHYGEQVAVPFQLQFQEQAFQQILAEQAHAQELDRQFDKEDKLYLIEERIRRLNS